MPAQPVVENITHQGGLSRARNARNTRPRPNGQRDRNVFQIVLCRVTDFELWQTYNVAQGTLSPAMLSEETSRDGLFMTAQLRRSPHGDQPPTVRASARPEVDDEIRCPDRRLVVFDYDDAVPLIAQLYESSEQHVVVARMQADGRFIEHITDTPEVRSQLRRQPDPLRLAPRQSVGSAIECEVAQSDLLQKLQPWQDLFHDVGGDLCLASIERNRTQILQRQTHSLVRNFRNRNAVYPDRSCPGIQAGPVTFRTRLFVQKRKETGDVCIGIIELLLQNPQHARLVVAEQLGSLTLRELCKRPLPGPRVLSRQLDQLPPQPATEWLQGSFERFTHRELGIGYEQFRIEGGKTAESVTMVARALPAVERKQARIEFFVTDSAIAAVEALAVDAFTLFAPHDHRAAAEADRRGDHLLQLFG